MARSESRSLVRELSPLERATCSELLSIAGLCDRIQTVEEVKTVLHARVAEILASVRLGADANCSLWALPDDQIEEALK